jgi:hypothetical protein
MTLQAARVCLILELMNLTDIDPLSPLMSEARQALIVYLAELPPDDDTPRRLTDWHFSETPEGDRVYASCEWEGEDGKTRSDEVTYTTAYGLVQL